MSVRTQHDRVPYTTAAQLRQDLAELRERYAQMQEQQRQQVLEPTLE